MSIRVILILQIIAAFASVEGASPTPQQAMEIAMEKPAYLYKILTYRNWQESENSKTVALSAEDSPFIHFSTEEQLEKIIAKYWSDVQQFVVLKIKMDQVPGDLRYETNPGGTTRYYHLYNGFIPTSAIVESRIIYRDSAKVGEKSPIVHIGNLVLRNEARALTKEEITTPKIQNLIETMKVTMRAAPGVGLAAPQIGEPLQIIVIEDMDHSHLTQQQLVERDRHKVPFHVIINPRIERVGEEAQFFEGCLSIPGYVAIVPRAKSVKVEGLNEKGEPIAIEARGWYARILQHEIDHLQATLYIDRAISATFMTDQNYSTLWKGKSVEEILASLAGI